MEISDILKKVKKIEIKSRQLSQMVFSGEYHSRFKGSGMNFSEVREYSYGDPIKNIDWNVSARFNKPFVKLFEEERENIVNLVVDISASNDFGTEREMKRELATEVAALLAFSAISNRDKIGLILFSDRVELVIPPKKGKKHTLRVIRELLSFEAKNTGTNIGNALSYFNNFQKKKSIVFLISDFISSEMEESLRIVKSKHDLIAIKINDNRERVLPNVGFINFRDSETGKYSLVDTTSSRVRAMYANLKRTFDTKMDKLFKKNGISNINLETGKEYVFDLVNLFKRRN